MRLCVFEDSAVHFLEPVALTRPVFDLRCGAGTLLERQCRVQRPEEVGVVVRPHLAELCRRQEPSACVNDSSWADRPGTVFVNARWFAASEAIGDLDRPRVGMVGDEVAYVVSPSLPCPQPEGVDAWLRACKERMLRVDAGGVLFSYLWEMVEHNGAALRQDWEWLSKSLTGHVGRIDIVGPSERLLVAEDAHIEPSVTADTRQGPVLIDRSAVVHSFTRLEGPCHVGPGSWVLGGKVRADTSIGPGSRVGGEVEASIILANSNKYHDGFLGHSYVGEWVNLAAGTQTSDLRNDYGMIRTTLAGQRIATKRNKLGSLIGDHTKTALGALLNTGSVIGAFANLLPSGSLLPQIVPSFCQAQHGQIHERWDLRQLFGTAATVMSRRGRELTDVHRDLYFHLYDQTAALRQKAIRATEMRRQRKSV